jgi:hypothetical protein
MHGIEVSGMAKGNTAKRSGGSGRRDAHGAAADAAGGIAPLPADIDELEIEGLEKETMDKVNHTISALETAMATWDAAGRKPPELKPKFVRYKLVHEILTRWQTKALRSMGRSTNIDERVGLLREFVDICKTYI